MSAHVVDRDTLERLELEHERRAHSAPITTITLAREAAAHAREFLRSYQGLHDAYRAILDNDNSFFAPAPPKIRYYYGIIQYIVRMYKMFPFHHPFIERFGFWKWTVLMETMYAEMLSQNFLERKAWVARETDDEPKQVDNLQYHQLRLSDPDFCESHLVSFAPPPPSRPTYSIYTVGVAYPSNKAYRHIKSHFGAINRVPRPQVETWIHHYATSDLLTGEMDPVALVWHGVDATALTRSTNPGSPKPHEITNWIPAGGAMLDREMGSWQRGVFPRPTESVCVAPDHSNFADDDEEQYHALLEFRADPEASLMRRIKEKLGFLSKKRRAEIYKEYLERQREEIELDHLREMEGVNAVDAAAMWEQDEQAAEDDEADAVTAVPDADYGYVPARPQLSEGDLWSEYWEYYYSMTITDRLKFVEALAWYGYNLALHVKWYAIRQEVAEIVKNGEATPDPNAPTAFPPDPAANVALGDHKPHVLRAFGVLPWGNHFMSTMHLATLVISTAKEVAKLAAAEAKEQAQTAAAAAAAALPPALPPARILADLDEAFRLMEEVGDTLVAAEKVTAEWLSRAIRARIFYPDTDELTDFEEESVPEEWFPPEVEDEEEEKPAKKGKGKKKKKGKKPKTAKGKGEGEEKAQE